MDFIGNCIFTARQIARRADCPTRYLICSLLVSVDTCCNLSNPDGFFKSNTYTCMSLYPTLLILSNLLHSYICLHGLLLPTCVVRLSSALKFVQVIRLVVIVSSYFLCSSSLVSNVHPFHRCKVLHGIWYTKSV